MTTTQTNWLPFSHNSQEGDRLRREWERAVEWCCDANIDLATDCTTPPDVMAEERTGVYLFRLDNTDGTPDRLITVEVDHDADGDSEGWKDLSRVVAVSIRRAR